jgi:hypothetical protein
MTVGLFVSIKQMEDKDLMNMSPVDQVTAYAELVRKSFRQYLTPFWKN